MKSILIIGAVAASMFTLCLLFSPVQADISLSGDLEIDTAYTSTTDESLVPSTDETKYDLGGRIKVVPAVRKEAGNLFLEAKAEVLAKTDGTAAIDDAWGKIGTSVFDLQIGRYEGWNLQDESNDMLIAEAPNGAARYKANLARGRIDSAGQLALHVLPSDAFGLELGFVYGQDSSDVLGYTDEEGNAVDIGTNVVGFRPVILSKFGPVEFAAGAEMVNITAQDDSSDADRSMLGFGARVKSTFSIVTLGINYASVTESGSDTDGSDLDDETTNSMGGYCDLALGKGVLTLAGFLTNWEEDNNVYEKTHNQYYIAYAHPLPIDGAAIKLAVSQANATAESAAGDAESDALAFKIRLNYNF